MFRIASRLLQLVLVMIGIMSLLFFLLRVSGDPVLALLGPDGAANRDAVTALRKAYGLDRPLYEQFAIFVSRAALLDFGESFVQRRPAIEVVLERVPASAALAATAMSLAVVVGLTLGIASAIAKSRVLRAVVAAVAVIGQSVPGFFLGLILILIFSVTLRLLPTFGFDGTASLILPSVSIALLPMARIARLSRTGMSQTLRQDFIVTAQSKGLAWRTIVRRHAIKNMMLPTLTLIGYDLVQLFGAQAVGEIVFAWPGIGSQLIRSAGERDYPVVMAITFVVTLVAVAVTLVVDLAYGWLDPRVRKAA